VYTRHPGRKSGSRSLSHSVPLGCVHVEYASPLSPCTAMMLTGNRWRSVAQGEGSSSRKRPNCSGRARAAARFELGEGDSVVLTVSLSSRFDRLFSFFSSFFITTTVSRLKKSGGPAVSVEQTEEE